MSIGELPRESQMPVKQIRLAQEARSIFRA